MIENTSLTLETVHKSETLFLYLLAGLHILELNIHSLPHFKFQGS